MPKKSTDTEMLSDAKLIKLAVEHDETKAEVAELTTVVERIKERVTKAMQARKTTKIVHDGHYITYVQAEVTEYDKEGLFAAVPIALQRKMSRAELDLNTLPAGTRKAVLNCLTPAQRKSIRVTVDMGLVSACIQDGEVDPRIVKKFSKLTKRAPYFIHDLVKKKGSK